MVLLCTKYACGLGAAGDGAVVKIIRLPPMGTEFDSQTLLHTGLSLLVLFSISAPRGFSLGTPVRSRLLLNANLRFDKSLLHLISEKCP